MEDPKKSYNEYVEAAKKQQAVSDRPSKKNEKE